MESYYPLVRREPFLIAYWRLNDGDGNLDALDYSARYDLTGIYSPSQNLGPALIQDDRSAGSSIFSSSSMAVGDIAQLRITSEVSIEAWIAPYVQTQSALIAGKQNSGATVAAPYALRLSNGQIQFALGNGTTETKVTAGVPPVSIPSHVVATYFRGTTTLYLNGEPVEIGMTGSQTITDGGQPLIVGSSFNGLVSELAVYNGALSARRVARHFTIGQQIIADPAHYMLVDPPVAA